MVACPSCGSTDIRRSQTRKLELPRKILTHRRPHRCRACHWRGWLAPQPRVDRSSEQMSLHVPLAEPNFEEIDAKLGRH